MRRIREHSFQDIQVPVVLSEAETIKIPLASISKVTSTKATPPGAGGMPYSSNLLNKHTGFVDSISYLGEKCYGTDAAYCTFHSWLIMIRDKIKCHKRQKYLFEDDLSEMVYSLMCS